MWCIVHPTFSFRTTDRLPLLSTPSKSRKSPFCVCIKWFPWKPLENIISSHSPFPKLASAWVLLASRAQSFIRELTQQDGWNTQDDRMTKKCGLRFEMHSLAPHFYVIQPSCCVSSLMKDWARVPRGTQSVCDVMNGVAWQRNAVSDVITTLEINFSVCNPTLFENFPIKNFGVFRGNFHILWHRLLCFLGNVVKAETLPSAEIWSEYCTLRVLFLHIRIYSILLYLKDYVKGNARVSQK